MLAFRSAMVRRTFIVLLGFAFAPACGPGHLPAEKIDVTPEAEFFPDATSAGRPIAVTYRWRVGPGFEPRGRRYEAFVHFVAADGGILIHDDHSPQPPSSEWEAGRSYEYTRLVFTPHQFPGPVEVRGGLYDVETRTRVSLGGHEGVESTYRLGRVETRQWSAKDAVRFDGGFAPPSADHRRPYDSLRWMHRAGTVSLFNPRADAVLFVRVHTHDGGGAAPQRLRIALGSYRTETLLSTEPVATLVFPIREESLGRDDRIEAFLEVSGADDDAGSAAGRVAVERILLCAASECPGNGVAGATRQ